MEASAEIIHTMHRFFDRLSAKDITAFYQLVELGEATLVLGTAPGEIVREEERLRFGFEFVRTRGPAWIARVRFSKTWRTAYFRGRTLERFTGLFDANFYDLDNGDEYWISDPKRDRTDARYSSQHPEVDENVRAEYEAFLNGAPLPGRENG